MQEMQNPSESQNKSVIAFLRQPQHNTLNLADIQKLKGKIHWSCARCILLKMSTDSMCKVCREPSTLKCGSCRKVSYCGKTHQKSDWKNHKPNCVSFKLECTYEYRDLDGWDSRQQDLISPLNFRPLVFGHLKLAARPVLLYIYTIQILIKMTVPVVRVYVFVIATKQKPVLYCKLQIVTNEKFGRHLIATRTIREGETIIKEPPIVAGPAQVTPPVCLGCHCLLSQFTARDCSTCGWPVCSEICEKSSAHRPECEITSRHKNGKVKINTFEPNLPHPSYQCLTVLRCLYLKKAQPELWKKLMELESHCKERAFTVKYNSDQMFIAEFIPKFFNFLDFSSEEILKVAGIIQVNAHEVPLREPEYIAIYEKASFLEHNCRANCMKSFTNAGELVIRAAEKISQGDHLSICYTDPLWGREMRMSHLIETKFFQCECQRCSDPTEFGTHFNSFKCTNRQCQGYVPPLKDFQTEIMETNEDDKILPKCQKCNTTISKLKNIELYDTVHQVDKKSAKSCKNFLEKYKNILHPNHHLQVSIKLALIDLFGWPSSLLSLPDLDLEWTINTCRELFRLTTKLIPAENRLRGLLLYHLQFALRENDRRKATRLKCDQSQMMEKLLERREVLLEAYTLLSYEPDELPEGKMAMDARQTLEEVDKILKTQSDLI